MHHLILKYSTQKNISRIMLSTYQLFHTHIKNPKTCTEFLLPNKEKKHKTSLGLTKKFLIPCALTPSLNMLIEKRYSSTAVMNVIPGTFIRVFSPPLRFVSLNATVIKIRRHYL